MLRALEKPVESLRAQFPEEIDDANFLAQLKDRYGVYITYDHKQKNRKAEAAAIKHSGVTAFWICPFWGKLVFWEQAKWLIARWENIESFAHSAVPGSCGEIQRNGRIRPFHI